MTAVNSTRVDWIPVGSTIDDAEIVMRFLDSLTYEERLALAQKRLAAIIEMRNECITRECPRIREQYGLTADDDVIQILKAEQERVKRRFKGSRILDRCMEILIQ